MSPPDFDTSEEASVFDEIRRERSTQSFAKGLILRVLGLAVIALAAWVISRNVSWTDTLLLETPAGKAAVPGTIEGDWQGAKVLFHPDEEADLAALLAPLALGVDQAAALTETSEIGRPWTAREGVLLLPGGRLLLATKKGLAREGAPADAAGLAWQVEWRPGMLRTFAEIDLLRLLPAIGFLILASLCVVTRWWRILHLNDCPTRWYDAFRYTYSGLFFNAVVPGINGGDVARAVAVVHRHPQRRAEAFMTVVIDRVVGLIGMIVVGTVLVLTTDERLDSIRLPVSIFCGAVLLGAVLFFHPGVRRLVRFEQLVQKLPQSERLQRLDAAALKLLHAPGELAIALVFSFANHVLNGYAV
ncbi:MAG: lysylphosphatidylglycerol synthase transmembrane domain-containing protein, partial [Planctomycetota bacterium]